MSQKPWDGGVNPLDKSMADIPYEPVVRDRKAERAHAQQIPGYEEARQEAGLPPENQNKYLRDLLSLWPHTRSRIEKLVNKRKWK